MAYVGILKEKGKYITSEQAFDYALERIENGAEQDKQEFVDWFYSGNFIKESEDI